MSKPLTEAEQLDGFKLIAKGLVPHLSPTEAEYRARQIMASLKLVGLVLAHAPDALFAIDDGGDAAEPSDTVLL